MVMQGENLSKKLVSTTKFDCYPGEDDSDEDDMDAMGQSFDIQSGTFIKILLCNFCI